jgi:hypothetical protein
MITRPRLAFMRTGCDSSRWRRSSKSEMRIPLRSGSGIASSSSTLHFCSVSSFDVASTGLDFCGFDFCGTGVASLRASRALVTTPEAGS